MEFLSADKRNVVLETVKKAEDGDGMIVRLYEVENARTKVTLHCAESILSAEETNLLEQPADGAIDVKENDFAYDQTVRDPYDPHPHREITYRNIKKTPYPKNGNTVSFQKAKSKNGCISRRWKRGTELWIPDT